MCGEINNVADMGSENSDDGELINKISCCILHTIL